MNQIERNTVPVEHESPSGVILINSDIGIRHQRIASALGLHINENTPFYARATNRLVDIIGNYFNSPIEVADSIEAKKGISYAMSAIQEEADQAGKQTFVLSFDPNYCDEDCADFTFQAARASLIHPGDRFIDLEHNDRGYINRFSQPGGNGTNGAGLQPELQVEQVKKLIVDYNPDSTDIVVVEDTVNTGTFLHQRLKSIFNSAYDLTVLCSICCPYGKEYLESNGIRVYPSHVMQSHPDKFIDISDLCPTIGGRMIGWSSSKSAYPVPKTTGGIGGVPVAVDAIIGNYPWQVDIYKNDLNTDLIHDLSQYALQTSLQFWDELEQAVGRTLTWKDLKKLNGKAKVFYPVRDLTVLNKTEIALYRGPKDLVEHLIKTYEHS